jgi:hypothetical protein
MRHSVFSIRGLAAALVLTAAGVAPAHAGFISTIDGNDCAGVYGQNFPKCKIPADPKNGIPKDTPIVIKFDFNDDGTLKLTTINPLFTTIDGSEFTWDFFSDGDGNTGTGTWTYTPGAGDPDINAFVAKGGPKFNLFSTGGVYSKVPFWTPTNPNNNKPYGLSHLSFYDSGGDQRLPEPGTLALLGLGFLGLGARRPRKLR